MRRWILEVTAGWKRLVCLSASSSTPPFFVWAPLFLGAVVMSSAVPPLQSPDETDHVRRAYLLSRGRPLLETPTGQSSGGAIDEGLTAYMHLFTVIVIDRAEYTPERRREAESLRWTKREAFAASPGTGYYFPAVYVPHALAFFIGRHLDFSIDVTYRFARLLCLLLSVWMIARAARAWPLSPSVLAVIVLPMTMFQMIAPTIDGVTTSLAVWWLAIWMRSIDPVQPLSRLDATVLVAGALILAGARIHLLPIVLLLLALAVVRRSRALGGASLALLLAVPAWLMTAIAMTRDMRVMRAVSTAEVAKHYVAHPFEFFAVLGRTFADRELREAYWHSLIGMLGWLDTPLEHWVYVRTTSALLALVALAVLGWRRADQRKARGLLMLGAVASMLLIMLALLVSWSPLPADVVHGVQGRYFVVPALMIAFAISVTPRGPSLLLLAGRVLLVVWSVLVFRSTVSSLHDRFGRSHLPPSTVVSDGSGS